MIRRTTVISPIRCGNPELVNVYKFGVSSGSIKSGVVRPNTRNSKVKESFSEKNKREILSVACGIQALEGSVSS